MRRHQLKIRRNGERGVALLITMFALVIVAAIGFSMMFQTDSETAINSNFRDQQSAYYAAAAGLEEARDRMASDAAAPITLPTALANQTGGVVYVTNTGETIQPWNNSTSNTYIDNELCPRSQTNNSLTVNGLDTPGETDCSWSAFPAASNWYASVSANAAYATNPIIPYKWTRITLKQNRSAAGTSSTLYVNGSSTNPNYYACWNGTNEFSNSSTPCPYPNRPVYLATTLAVTPSGTRRMLQYELARNISFTGSAPPGALTLLGPTVTASLPNSNNFVVDGHDHAGCGKTATSGDVPAITVQNNTVDGYVTGQIPNNKADHYTGSGATSADVEVGTLSKDYQTVADLEAAIALIKTGAVANGTYYSSNPSSTIFNRGSQNSPVIAYVDGDFSPSGDGWGILVVRGTYSPNGNFGWNGMVFVVGKGTVTASGGGNGQYNGSMVVANTLDNSGNALTTFGTPTFNWNGGGGNGILYSTGCFMQQPTLDVAKKDYHVLASRELMY